MNKKTIKLTESQLNEFIFETCRKILGEDIDYMSDEDIANQYSDMKVTYFEINPLRNSEGWKGTFELEFPNADNIDYDSTMVNDFIAYDSEGNRIAWDNWMPDEQTKYLNDIIRNEIAKRNVKESISRTINEISESYEYGTPNSATCNQLDKLLSLTPSKLSTNELIRMNNYYDAYSECLQQADKEQWDEVANELQNRGYFE